MNGGREAFMSNGAITFSFTVDTAEARMALTETLFVLARAKKGAHHAVRVLRERMVRDCETIEDLQPHLSSSNPEIRQAAYARIPEVSS